MNYLFKSIITALLFCQLSAHAQSDPFQGCQSDFKVPRKVGFEQWLQQVFSEAQQKGVSADAIYMATPYMTIDNNIIAKDRAQSVFNQDFLTFSDKRAGNQMVDAARAKVKANRKLFSRVENDYGIPAAVIAAFWGLESSFGADTGKYNVLRSVTTLAYDCRRPDKFQPQLIALLQNIDRNQLDPSEMVGSWAGELGGLQFIPGHYLDYGVDYDGDGRANLIGNQSVPDTIATAGNFLRAMGWQPGQPWFQEVIVPNELPWEQADLEIQLPVAKWKQWGVRAADGNSLHENLQASLLLPMGRNGPAFLAYPNFRVYLEWNDAMVYSTTVAYLSTRIEGAAKVRRGNGKVDVLTVDEIKAVQRGLQRLGYDVGAGGADGKIGKLTRAAIKQAQLQAGLPADSYPDYKLLRWLQGG